MALAFALLAGGCHAWYTQPVTPSQLLAAGQQSTMRVTRRDSTVGTGRSRVVLNGPTVRGDTLEGWKQRKNFSPLLVRIPLADVQGVETRGYSPGRTIGLALAIALGLAAALLTVVWIGLSSAE